MKMLPFVVDNHEAGVEPRYIGIASRLHGGNVTKSHTHKRLCMGGFFRLRPGDLRRKPDLPPYSPDLNPIEQAFAKLKALLRKAAPRTVEALWNVIGESLAAFSLRECANYLADAGYRRSV